MTLMKTFFVGAIAAAALAGAASAQSALTQQQLEKLLANGAVLTLGSADLGYSGDLKLGKDGKGKGSVVLPSGEKRSITGNWTLRDGQFCRQWKEFDDNRETCETWVLTSPRSVDVVVDGHKIGVNSW